MAFGQLWSSGELRSPAGQICGSEGDRVDPLRSVQSGTAREVAVEDDALGPDQQSSIVSVYEDKTRTIVLPVGWQGITPAELSILVHEAVHHLQNAAGLTYACPQEREALAYEAQEKWLSLFGRSLSSEFQIDGMTLLVNTKCLY
ncbi:MAG: DUF6647 family protein [Hyphomicrobium sp.]